MKSFNYFFTVCKCGKEFSSRYAFSSHRCKFKKNAGAYLK